MPSRQATAWSCACAHIPVPYTTTQGGQQLNILQLGQEFLQDAYREVQFEGRNVLSELEGKMHGTAWQAIDEPDRQWAVVYYCLRAGFGVASHTHAAQDDVDRAKVLQYVRDRQATFGAPFIDQLDAYLRGDPYVSCVLALALLTAQFGPLGENTRARSVV